MPSTTRNSAQRCHSERRPSRSRRILSRDEGVPFFCLVQKKGTKENDTREGKISFSPPPWTLPHSNDQTGLASPFGISPGIRPRSLCGGWHPQQPVSSRRRGHHDAPAQAFPAHGEGGPLAVDEVPARRIKDSFAPGQVGRVVCPVASISLYNSVISMPS